MPAGQHLTQYSREHWMIYRGPSFLAVAWFGSSPTPSPPSPVSKLSLFLSLPVCRRSSLLTGEEGTQGRRGKEPNQSACSSINHSKFSAVPYGTLHFTGLSITNISRLCKSYPGRFSSLFTYLWKGVSFNNPPFIIILQWPPPATP